MNLIAEYKSKEGIIHLYDKVSLELDPRITPELGRIAILTLDEKLYCPSNGAKKIANREYKCSNCKNRNPLAYKICENENENYIDILFPDIAKTYPEYFI